MYVKKFTMFSKNLFNIQNFWLIFQNSIAILWVQRRRLKLVAGGPHSSHKVVCEPLTLGSYYGMFLVEQSIRGSGGNFPVI